MEYEIVKSSTGVLESTDKCEILLTSDDVLDNPDAKTVAMLKRVASGSTAYTADLALIAMKDPNGVWKEIGGDREWTF